MRFGLLIWTFEQKARYTPRLLPHRRVIIPYKKEWKTTIQTHKSPKNAFGPWEESNISCYFYSQEIFSLVKNNNIVVCVSQASTPTSPENVWKSGQPRAILLATCTDINSTRTSGMEDSLDRHCDHEGYGTLLKDTWRAKKCPGTSPLTFQPCNCQPDPSSVAVLFKMFKKNTPISIRTEPPKRARYEKSGSNT